MTLHQLFDDFSTPADKGPVVRDGEALRTWQRRDRRVQWVLFGALGGLLLETWLRLGGFIPTVAGEIMFGLILGGAMATTVWLALTGPRVEVPVDELADEGVTADEDAVVVGRIHEQAPVEHRRAA